MYYIIRDHDREKFEKEKTMRQIVKSYRKNTVKKRFILK